MNQYKTDRMWAKARCIHTEGSIRRQYGTADRLYFFILSVWSGYDKKDRSNF